MENLNDELLHTYLNMLQNNLILRRLGRAISVRLRNQASYRNIQLIQSDLKQKNVVGFYVAVTMA